MRAFIIIAAFSALAGCNAAIADTRIIGGVAAKPGEFPFIVSLQQFNATTGVYRHFCAGTIYDTTHIVTAGHCVWDLVNKTAILRIVAGAYDISNNAEASQQSVNISKIFVNPNYTTGNTAGPNDVAVLELVSALVFGTFVGPLPLNDKGHVAQGSCVSIGWGNTFPITSIYYKPSSTLNKVATKVLDPLLCALAYPLNSNQRVNTICASGPAANLFTFFIPRGTCQGDSGGPFMCNDNANKTYYLAGIVSWGFVACGTLPDVYSDVGALRGFLDSVLIPQQSA